LSNEVFAHFFSEVIAYIDQYGAGAIGIKQASDDLKASFAKVQTALDVVRKSRFTESLEAQDKFRDKQSRGLGATLKALLDDPEGANMDDARELNLLFDHYWSLPRRTYDAETEAIQDLFREFDKPANVARIALFGLTAVVERFRVANNKFEALMRQRYVQAEEIPEINMKEARAEVKEKFEILLNRLDAIITLNGIDFSEELTGFVHGYNIVATRYKHILAQEQGRRKAAREKGENENPDDEGNDDPDYEDNDDNNTPETPEEQ
jgi:hypothetical protein